MFTLSAVYSGMWFWRWATERVKKQMRGQLGWFSGLVCVGSVAGAVAWSAQMQNNALSYKGSVPGLDDRQAYVPFTSATRWSAVFSFLYPVEFLCFIIAKLLMLGRLTNNATRSLQAHAQELGASRGQSFSGGALAVVYRMTAAAAVLCSVGGMVALDVAGAYILQVAGLYDQAAFSCDAQGSNTNATIALRNQIIAINPKAATAASLQAILEAIALLLIAAAYLVLVPLSVAMFRRAERIGSHQLVVVAARVSGSHQPVTRPTVAARVSESGQTNEAAAAVLDEMIQAAAEQRQRLVIACVVVLFTFPARAAFDLLNAYSSFNDPYNPACGICDPCQSTRVLVQFWIFNTPEFQPIVVALSSPLPLLVSLWILTGAYAQAYAISLSILRARLGRRMTWRSSAVENRSPLIA